MTSAASLSSTENGAGFVRRAAGRLAEYGIVLSAMLAVNFAAMQALPGDPLLMLFGGAETMHDASGQDALRRAYGLGGSAGRQFLGYLTHLARGDLGYSTSHAAPVAEVIGQVLPWTLLLVAAALSLCVPVGILTGLEAARRHSRSSDRCLLTVSALLDSVPPFTKAMLVLMVVCVDLGWLPVSGAMTPFTQATGPDLWWDVAHHAAAPVLVLCLHFVTKFAMSSRAAAVAVLSRPFMIVAEAKGLPPMRLRGAYLGRNAAAVILAHGVGMAGGMISGAVFVEMTFSYPGIGLIVWNGVADRDYALVQGSLLVLGGTILLLNLVADIVILALGKRG